VSKKPRIGVVLTSEARTALEDEPVRLFLREGRHFNCDSIDQDGYLLHMEVREPDTDDAFRVTIPIQFVLYIVSTETGSMLGFK